jgi:RNA polymerase sigma-70 factor (ECF subfamily)
MPHANACHSTNVYTESSWQQEFCSDSSSVICTSGLGISSPSHDMPLPDVQPDSADTFRLLRQAEAGDRLAFEELFVRHRRYLRQVIDLRLDPRLRTRVDASDIVQEAHCEALRRLEVYLEARPLPFRLWLRQIACDCALKARRQHLGTARRALNREMALPERSSLLLARQLAASGGSPSRALARGEMVARVRTALDRLSEADREIILLRHFEGLSNQEVGSLLGIDSATASKRHGRAMLRLHRILFEGGLRESQL